MATPSRTWIKTDAPDRSRTEWRSTDGQALVVATRTLGNWEVEIFESDGHGPLAWIGSEGPFPYRVGAMGPARNWVRRLTRPCKA